MEISFSILTFLFLHKKIQAFFYYVRNRKAVKKHVVFMAIWASQIENI